MRRFLLSNTTWRRVLLSLSAIAIVLFVAALGVDFTRGGMFGVTPTYRAAGIPFQTTVVVTPGGSAARAGVRTGDVIDERRMTPADRYRLNWGHGTAMLGAHLTLPILRGSQITPIRLIARHVSWTWDNWIVVASFAWMIFFGILIAWKRSNRSEARVLSLILLVMVIFQLTSPGNFTTPWIGLDLTAAVMGMPIYAASIGLFATYSTLFGRPQGTLRTWLVRSTYAIVALGCAESIARLFAEWSGSVDTFGVWIHVVDPAIGTAGSILALLCVLFAFLKSRGTERARLSWSFTPIALVQVEGLISPLSFISPSWAIAIQLASNVSIFILPLGLAYALLNRRLLDLGFVLNRAAVFTGVSVIIVGAFVLLEWALSDWLSHMSHSTNVIVGGGLALALGLSIRFVHGRVEHVVDNVFFRKRRQAEQAVRTMAAEAPYITDREALLQRTEQTLLRFADASFVRVLLASTGSAALRHAQRDTGVQHDTIDENDPAMVALRARHAVLDLHTVETAIQGEFAYPMVARGIVLGALVLGPKASGESYAPDEAAAIATLAHSVAGALDVIDLKHGNSERSEALLQRIDAGFAQLSKQIARIGAQHDPETV